MGTATAGVNFFRSMGSAFGVAIFGTILTNRLNHNLGEQLPPGSDLTAAEVLGSTPAQLLALPDAIRTAATESFAQSLQTTFLFVIPAAVLAFVLTWFLREVPLKQALHEVEPEGVPGPTADEISPTANARTA
jgi:hypothetical protein